EGIAEVWPGSIDPAGVETNILYLDTGDRDAEQLAAALHDRGVNVGPMGARKIRMVTHRDVEAAGIERALDAFRAILG
ncbi:MAG: threonine aldolase, partial [Actinomycetota bacterium]